MDAGEVHCPSEFDPIFEPLTSDEIDEIVRDLFKFLDEESPDLAPAPTGDDLMDECFPHGDHGEA